MEQQVEIKRTDEGVQTRQKIAEEKNDPQLPGTELVYPMEDIGDYDAYVKFTVLEDVPVDIAGLLDGFGKHIEATFSRTQKVNEETEEPLPQTAEEKKAAIEEEEKAIESMQGDILKEAVNIDGNFKNGQVIKLYMPQGIQIVDNVQYDNAELGAIGGSAVGAMGSGQGALAGAIQGGMGGITALVDSFKGAAGTDAARLAMVRASSSFGTAGEAVKSVARVALNPNVRTLFKSVGIREFSFTFIFIAQSKKEAEEIKKIIKVFRRELYPEKIGAFGDNDTESSLSLGYKFPNRFSIELMHNEKSVATKLLPCYLRNFQATYNPNSMGMHDDGNFQEIQITMSFAESRTLSKSDIDKGF